MRIDLDDGYRLRAFEEGDIESIVKYANNRKVAQTLEDRFPHPYGRIDAAAWLESLAKQDPLTHFAIATEEEAIGSIGMNLRHDVYFRTGEIGYWLGEPFWGRGIATSAVRALSRWAFLSFDLVRLQARVFDSNSASRKVLEKAGFTYEGRLRQAATKNGKTMDLHIYALLRNELEKTS